MRRVLVTGATGFVAQALIPALRARGWFVRAASRDKPIPGANEMTVVGDIRKTDWSNAVREMDSVVHLAARVHRLHDSAVQEAEVAYRETNEIASIRLGEAARQAGVERLIFLSSIKVNGEYTGTAAFTASDVVSPRDAYARSKWEAECGLRELVTPAFAVTCIRPPLVFGAGVRANFLRMLRWIDRGIPLPLGGIHNRRSLISVWNLADLIVTLLEHPRVPPPVVMAAEELAISTPDLLRMLADAMGRKVRLYSVPRPILQVLANALGKRGEFDRLYTSLVVDTNLVTSVVGWRPPLTLAEGFERTVSWYLSERNGRH